MFWFFLMNLSADEKVLNLQVELLYLCKKRQVKAEIQHFHLLRENIFCKDPMFPLCST